MSFFLFFRVKPGQSPHLSASLLPHAFGAFADSSPWFPFAFIVALWRPTRSSNVFPTSLQMNVKIVPTFFLNVRFLFPSPRKTWFRSRATFLLCLVVDTPSPSSTRNLGSTCQPFFRPSWLLHSKTVSVVLGSMEQRTEGCAEVPTAREPQEPADLTERDGGEAGNAGKKALRNAVRRALLCGQCRYRGNTLASIGEIALKEIDQESSRIPGICFGWLPSPGVAPCS